MVTVARGMMDKILELGVDRIYLVSGTDYAQFIAEKVKGHSLHFEVIPHEITAASAALGYSLAGKVGVVGLHTTPGTLNASGVIMMARASRIPLIVLAGKSPYTVVGNPASRDLRIHWLQDIPDQGGIVRQFVKFEHEVRDPSQSLGSLERGFYIALSEPAGPVYITFPREVTLCPLPPTRGDIMTSPPSVPGPSPKSLDLARRIIDSSDNPVLLPWRVGRKGSWYEALRKFSERYSIPVLNYIGETPNYPQSGPMALDYADLSDYDLIISVENDIPFIPSRVKTEARVIRIDTDPDYSYIPFMGIRCDLCVRSDPGEFLNQLSLRERDRRVVEEEHERQRESREKEIRSLQSRSSIHPRLLSYEVGRLGLPVLNEYPLNSKFLGDREPGDYFGDPSLGYLGWALGASVGFSAVMGPTVAAVGDGSFLFGVPEAFYSVARKYPVLVVVFDNGGWLSVEESVNRIAGETSPSPPGTVFESEGLGKGIELWGGVYAEVWEPEDLRGALERGKETVLRGRPSLVRVHVERTR